MAARADRRCEYCRAPEHIFNYAFEVEHIQPRAAGGNDALDNLALSCASCNSHKATTTSALDEETRQMTALFHPRQGRWSEHFRYDSETGLVQGITPAGRVTVTRLRLNSDFQLRARHHWIQLKIYP